MATNTTPSRFEDAAYPGASLGLPATGRGSLASWRARITALVLDWAASMMVAVGIFGSAVLDGAGWRAWMILAVFFVEATVLSSVASGTFGQLLCRIAIARLDRKPLGFVRGIARAAMVSLAIPALVIGPERRGLHDLAVGTVVINRR
ncbi:MAG TPA: RDD family protein [Propionibacteriaceae bacterium]|nr:RDD family protein [Propionibacteriaceae bacterium]